VRPGGLELPTSWFVAKRSIQLSYGRTVFDSTTTTSGGSPFDDLVR
jgi:hypothetical protein